VRCAHAPLVRHSRPTLALNAVAPTVSFAKLLDAYEWVSAGEQFDAEAYISRGTGQIFLAAESGDFESELPDDVGDDSLYAAIPNKSDLELGRSLVFRFVAERIPEAYARVEKIFGRRGAYGQYKSLLEGVGLLDDWHAYEAEAVEVSLREWARENGINLDDDAKDEG
jgi:hypothetical protein